MNSWLQTRSGLPAYNTPKVLITELQLSLEEIIPQNPDSSLEIANMLWDESHYEAKTMAYWILFNLPMEYIPQIFEKMNMWIEENPDDYLITQMTNTCFEKEALLLSDPCLNSINRWLQSEDIQQKRIGIEALKNLTQSKQFTNLPKIFQMIRPLIINQRFEVRKDLLNLIQVMITRSEAETASFLIATGEIQTNDRVLAFIRKCLPLFNEPFQKELQSALFNQGFEMV